MATDTVKSLTNRKAHTILLSLIRVQTRTCQSNVHLGGLVVEQEVVQRGDGVEQDSVHLGGEQPHEVGDAPTIIDHQKTFPAIAKDTQHTIIAKFLQFQHKVQQMF